jgi:hypothetical protein
VERERRKENMTEGNHKSEEYTELLEELMDLLTSYEYVYPMILSTKI